MSAKDSEIYVIILIGMLLAFFLFGFILTILFTYRRKQFRQKQEMTRMKDQYERELLRSQLEIQESTLKSIALELHDNIGQVLSVIKLWMAILPIEKEHPAYEGVQSSREMLNKVIFDMADLTKSLHTDRITDIGLSQAIRFEVETLLKTGMLEINYSSKGNEGYLDGQKSIFLFRIFQEVMNNTLKHAKATRVDISITFSERLFRLNVSDNGVGFNPELKKTEAKGSSGLGLKSMVNRARLIGAEIAINSQAGVGTNVTVELPLELDS